LRTLRQLLSGEDVIQLAIRLGLLAFLIYWTFLLIQPFVPILAWSIVLAVAFHPVFDFLSKLLGGRPRLAAAILTVVNLAVVIGPATWLGLGALDGVKEIAGNPRRKASSNGHSLVRSFTSSGTRHPTTFGRRCAKRPRI